MADTMYIHKGFIHLFYIITIRHIMYTIQNKLCYKAFSHYYRGFSPSTPYTAFVVLKACETKIMGK